MIKRLKFNSILLIVAGITLAIYIRIVHFVNPELTEMQLFLMYWKELCIYLLLLIAWALYRAKTT